MRGMNVLVVEDDDAVRARLIEMLRGQGHLNAHGARDGVEALHHVSSTAYSVILLDMMMPKMNGVDFLDSLKAMSNDASIKSLPATPVVIVMTGAPPEEIPDGSIRQRFPDLVQAVLRKPLDYAQLALEVQRVVPRASDKF